MLVLFSFLSLFVFFVVFLMVFMFFFDGRIILILFVLMSFLRKSLDFGFLIFLMILGVVKFFILVFWMKKVEFMIVFFFFFFYCL